MTDATDTTYPYAGVPLMPGTLGELVLELFSGRIARRSEIASDCLAVHLERGGLPPTSDPLLVTKKALADLHAAGKVSKTGAYGTWRIAGDHVAEVSPPPQSADALEYIHPTAFSAGVYAYCYPAYRELAAQRGELHWPVKIGMSDLDITSRVAAQAATALPEAPELICEFTSDTPRLLERAIHSILALRGRIMDDAPGSEWFMTNPDELREIVEWIGGDDRD